MSISSFCSGSTDVADTDFVVADADFVVADADFVAAEDDFVAPFSSSTVVVIVAGFGTAVSVAATNFCHCWVDGLVLATVTT